MINVEHLVQCWLLRGWSSDGRCDGIGGGGQFLKKTSLRFKLDVEQKVRIYCEEVSRKDILGEEQQQKQREKGDQNLYQSQSVRKRVKYKVNLLDAS